MTDPNLAEQAEREIADQLGFKIVSVIEDGQTYPGIHVGEQYYCDLNDTQILALWQALVRDRCSLLKLTEALKMVRGFKRALDNDGCQISSDTRHVRCLRQFAVDIDKLAESALSALEGK